MCCLVGDKVRAHFSHQIGEDIYTYMKELHTPTGTTCCWGSLSIRAE